jgi:histidinol-phosphate aminotransferase
MLSPKPHIAGLPPAVHGSIDYSEIAALGISPDAVLDFSVNCNPYGPPPVIHDTIAQLNIDRYPDTESSELCDTLAKTLNIPAKCIIAGSGTTELIRLIALAFFNPGDPVLIPQPTYSEYETSCRIMNTQVTGNPVFVPPAFQPDTGKIIEAIHKYHPRGIFLCNPNNPTGQYLSGDEMTEILSHAPDSLVVIDEAYIAFTENTWQSSSLIDSGNVIILRSMTKDYALAGLRIGYALSDINTIDTLTRIKPPWNVNTIAQRAAIRALNDNNYIDECAARIKEAKGYLIKELTALGFSVVPSKTNFFMVRVLDATAFRKDLLNKGILMRDCTSFGLPQYIRIAPRTLPECGKLIDTVRDLGAALYAG